MERREFSIEEEMELMAQELQRHFSHSELNKLAREVGFVKRRSTFTAKDLIFLCVYSSEKIVKNTLNLSCSRLESETEVSLSSQGLNERINESSVEFLKALFTSLLQKKLFITSDLPSLLGYYFNRIRILNSTAF